MRKIVTFLFIITLGFTLGFWSAHYHKSPHRILKSLRPPVTGEQTTNSREPERGSDRNDKVRPNDALDTITSLPYLTGYKEAPQRSGVTKYDPSLADQGLNLYVSGHAPEAILMDMNGRVVHRWRYEFERTWPRYRQPRCVDISPDYWRRIKLLDDGDLLALFEYYGIIKVNRASKLQWSYDGHCHHDFSVRDDGTIYVLTYKEGINPEVNPSLPIVEDYITIISPEGKKLSEVSLLSLFKKSRYAYLLPQITDECAEVFHTNTLEVFDGRLAGRSPIYKAGNLLIACRNINSVAIIDPGTEEIVWLWGPNNLVAPHQPTLLPNGNILIFNNYVLSSKDTDGPTIRSESSVIEIDPLSLEIVWEYRGDAKNPFFSKVFGSEQRLSNGNTLIIDSVNGRALEVTKDKTIVWEFLNPHKTGEKNELIATIPELIRVDPADLSFLPHSIPSP